MSEAPWNVEAEFPPSEVSAWRALAEKGLRGKPFEVLRSKLDGGIVLEPLYTEDSPASATFGMPGVTPYVRGTSPFGRAETGWVVRQEYDDPRMDRARDEIAEDLARGCDGIWLRAGIDQGVRVLTAGDLARVLESVDLARTSVCLEPEADFLPVAAAFVSLADARGVARGALVGSFGVDPIGTIARSGRMPSGLDSALRDATDMAAFAVRETPHVRTFLANSRVYADAGASAVHELAYTIATGVAYLRRLVQSGMSVDDASRQVMFALSVAGPFFVDVAKLRAARLLWAKVVSAAGGSSESQAMVIHARTALFTKTVRDPWVNMLRTTAESFAAAIGGADSIATAPFDVALGPPEKLGRRVARNQQLMLRDESHLHRVADPAGGSYYVDSLTDQLARLAWEELRKVEEHGGMERAITHGHVARTLSGTNEKRVADILRRKRPIVGVSEFPNLDEETQRRDFVDWSLVEGELGHNFGEGTPEQRHAALMELSRLAQAPERTHGELMARAVAATTLGVDFYSLSAVHRVGRVAVFTEPLPQFRAAVAFEALRMAADVFADQRGRRPRMAMVCLGSVAEHGARAGWVRNLVGVGGIEAVEIAGGDVAATAAAFENAQADFAVLVGADAAYVAAAPELCTALREKGARVIATAGKPGDSEDALREAGIDAFFFTGEDVHALLVGLHSQLGGAR